MLGAILCMLWAGLNDQSELDHWVRRWAASTEVFRFHADFVSTTDSGTTLKGQWDFRLRPSFAQYVAFEVYEGGRFVQKRMASWSLARGVGKEFIRQGSSVLGSGTVGALPPEVLGFMTLPNCPPFFFAEDRTLAGYMELANVTARKVGSDGDDIEVFLTRPEAYNVLEVYRLDRRRPQPVTEYRIYVRKVAFPKGKSLPQSETGEDIELPEEFRDSFLFVRIKILRSIAVAGREVPMEWRVIHGLGRPGHETTISLVPESIVIDGPEPDHGYDFVWPPGASVYDRFQGQGYNAGRSGKQVRGDVITEAGLDDILAGAGFEHTGADSADRTDGQVTNCAANALYLCLATLGRARSLRELVEDLGVDEEHEQSTMADIARVCRAQGQACQVIRGDRSLLERESTVPLLLHVRVDRRHRDQAHPVDHYYVVDSFDPKANTIRVFDPPGLPFRSRLSDVEKVWTGYVLVFGDRTIQEISRAARTTWWWRVVLILAGGGFLVVAIISAARGRRTRQAAVLVPVLLSMCAFIGCDWSSSPDTGEASIKPSVGEAEAGRVEVVDGHEVDLGRVKWNSDVLSHRFVLFNDTDRTLNIVKVRQNCSCLDVDFPPKTFPAGETMPVDIRMDARGIAGPKAAEAGLFFDDPGVKPVHLKLSAYIEREYMVHVQPLIWQLPAPEGGRVARKTFLVREFLPYDAAETADTAVHPAVPQDGLRVVSLGAWSKIGRAVYGYAREAELTVEYEPPDEGPFERRVALTFQHRSETKTIETALTYNVPLRVRQ